MKKVISFLYVLMVILLLVLLCQCLLYVYYEKIGAYLWNFEEVWICFVCCAAAGGISYLLYRLRCRWKILSRVKLFFGVLMLIGTLIAEIIICIWKGYEIGECADSFAKAKKSKQEIERIIEELSTNDRPAAESTMMWYYGHKNFTRWLEGRRNYADFELETGSDFTDFETEGDWGDYAKTFGGGYGGRGCGEETYKYYHAALERWAAEGSDVAEFLMGERYLGYFYYKIDNNYNYYNEKEEEARDGREHAFYWWSRAAAHGNVNACVRMAQCYEEYLDVPTLYKNEKLALSWWKKAAEGGSSKAYYELGLKCAQRNMIEEARQFWEIAAEMGDENAMNALEKVYSKEVQPGARKNNPL